MITMYEVGYYNKPYCKEEWRTVATAISKEIAQTIVCAMNVKYEQAGLSARLTYK